MNLITKFTLYTAHLPASEANTEMPEMYNSSNVANFSYTVKNGSPTRVLQGDDRHIIFGSHSFHEVTMTYPMRYARLIAVIRLYCFLNMFEFRLSSQTFFSSSIVLIYANITRNVNVDNEGRMR